VAPFLGIFGLSYLFIEFGPNSTTFVLPSELFPVRARTTGHGISAGLGKLGAFVGVFLVPSLQAHIGLRGMLIVAALASLGGMALTLLLRSRPEGPSTRLRGQHSPAPGHSRRSHRGGGRAGQPGGLAGGR